MTREKLIEAAREVFSRYGYRSASTNRIVRDAGVSKGILFNHFGTKKELYLSILIDELERFVRTVAAKELAGTDPVSRFEQLIGETFRYYNEHRTAFVLMMSATEVERPLQNELLARLSAASLPDLIDRVVEGVDASLMTIDRSELRQLLDLVLNGIKQTISANVRAETSAEDLERLFCQQLSLLTRVLRGGIYRGGAP